MILSKFVYPLNVRKMNILHMKLILGFEEII